MHFSTLIAPLIGLAATPAVAETIFGIVVFSRHGDRTSKHYNGYTLTDLGEEENFGVGTSFRSRYLLSSSPQRILNISQDKYSPSQVYASAPNQNVLLNTATRFLQGLYPPLVAINAAAATEQLTNGSSVQGPLGGYQYVMLNGEPTNSPDTIWIKGADMCPAVTTAQATYANSTMYQTLLSSTKSFYAQFWDILQHVYDYKQSDLTYAKAYDIFDLINTGSEQNLTFPRNVSASDLFQLRTLADSAEFNSNYNTTMNARSIGGQTMGGAIVSQLNQTIATKGSLKLSLLAGSYNTILSFFGLTNLTAASPDFYGLPDYASTLTFELFTAANTTTFPSNVNDLNVRFVFKNGSQGTFTTFPLFGGSNMSIAWPDFVNQMKSRTITTPQGWCDVCGVTSGFCLEYAANSSSSGSGASSSNGSNKGMSLAVAGVIGAFVTIGVLGLLGALAALVLLCRRKRTTRSPTTSERKLSAGSSGASA